MRVLVLSALMLGLAACASSPPVGPGDPGPNGTPPPIPVDGPIAYRCADGTQLMVDVETNSARVAIIGGPAMVLPRAGDGYYSNGRYGFRGGGATASIHSLPGGRPLRVCAAVGDRGTGLRGRHGDRNGGSLPRLRLVPEDPPDGPGG